MCLQLQALHSDVDLLEVDQVLDLLRVLVIDQMVRVRFPGHPVIRVRVLDRPTINLVGLVPLVDLVRLVVQELKLQPEILVVTLLHIFQFEEI